MKRKKNLTEAPFSDSELKSFLGTRRIVIADSARPSGRSLRKFFMQLGSKPTDVFHCETLDEARTVVSKEKTHLLFVDASFGLEIVNLQRSAFESGNDCATVVLTADPSASEMGQLLEADYDALLIKPFHYQAFLEALWTALSEKLKPTPYLIQIEKAKGLYRAGSYEEARLVFEAAKALESRPTLVFYYLGMIQSILGNFQKAVELFESGLALDATDYRCMNGLFEVRVKKSEFKEAYELAKRIHADYPASPQRVLELVKLSVQIRRFEDVLDYCKIFRSLEKREPTLCRAIIAGMLVCSKYLVLKSNRERGLEVLRDAARLSLETRLLHLDVLRYFLETENAAEGVAFYDSLPEETRKLPDVSALHRMLEKSRTAT